jgi:hypothetical protein
MYILYTWDIWTTYEHFFGIIYAIVYKVLGLLILDYFTAKIQYITNFSGLEKWVLWTGMKSCSPCSSCREKAQISCCRVYELFSCLGRAGEDLKFGGLHMSWLLWWELGWWLSETATLI